MNTKLSLNIFGSFSAHTSLEILADAMASPVFSAPSERKIYFKIILFSYL